MSMDRCSDCERLVDTDLDCDFYDYSHKANDLGGHCVWCREKMPESSQDAGK